VVVEVSSAGFSGAAFPAVLSVGASLLFGPALSVGTALSVGAGLTGGGTAAIACVEVSSPEFSL
jgi:hypothetical protein